MPDLENSMVMGDYYPEPEPRLDEDTEYERIRQLEVDEAARERERMKTT